MSFNATLINLLKTHPPFVDDEGELVLAAVQNSAWKTDHALMRILLTNTETKAKFFDEIAGHWLFNTNTFLDYVSQKDFLDNSYTRYRNRIGLTIGDKFMHERGEVALSWPYKDCMLEGGQTKDQEKRKEIFFNEVLAEDEITCLKKPKVLTAFTRYTAKGSEKVENFRRDEDGVIRENMIIKGNNLLALHTLKEQFRGKVKLIYIDPPYNTGNDSFGYNDNFNHSTWLTFMKNRLEVARELLRDDGVIFVQCDDNEQAYLKILMDEVFGRESFIANIIWQKKSGGGQDSETFTKEHEYLLVFKKKNWEISEEKTDYIELDFSKLINNRKAKLLKLEKWGSGAYKTDRPSLFYSIKNPNGEDYFPMAPDGKDGRWRKKPESLDEKHIKWEMRDNKLIPYEVIYFDEMENQKKVVKTRTLWFDDGNTTEATKEIKLIFGDKLFTTPKPEKLLNRIMERTTNELDIVLDFFAGSGTTAAVAHKMGRQYIGVEQMDYIQSITVERMKKVIGGEQGGISKNVNWQGGGDFIYCELMPYNEAFINRIQTATDTPTLINIWREMAESSFLNWYVSPEVPENALREFSEIGNMPDGVDKQKKLLIELLDKNQLYVNKSEIADKKFKVSAEDKKLNRLFYGENQ